MPSELPSSGKLISAVKAIKGAILRSRYEAARQANAEQLKLYFAIGGFVSANSREGKWGAGAIDAISKQLQQELPGLRGFSASSIRYMRLFYEAWEEELFPPAIRQSLIGELTTDAAGTSNHHSASDDLKRTPLKPFRQSVSDEISPNDIIHFERVSFTHHREILTACKTSAERWHYIRRCAAEFWSVRTLKSRIKADDFSRFGTLPNNFALTLPDTKQAARAVQSLSLRRLAQQSVKIHGDRRQ